MGMYDELTCKYKLPLAEEHASLSEDWSKVIFQTKDLDNCLCHYIIDESGNLYEEIIEREYIYYTKDERKNNKDIKPWNLWKDVKEISRTNKQIDYHGTIRFYGDFKLPAENILWLEFDAYFIYGKLDKIVLAKTDIRKLTSHNLDELIKEQKKIQNSVPYKVKRYLGWFWCWKQLSKCFNSLSRFFSELNAVAIRRLILLIAFTLCYEASAAEISFNGNIDYEKQLNQRLSSKNTLETRFKLYEHPKFLLSISNAISVDLDCFQQEIKESLVFTTLRVDF